jgi:hypothetical protein
MTNYQNGKIYKIEAINGEEGDIYIGNTCRQYLSQRMDAHRYDYKRWKEGKLKYRTTSFQLFDKYGIENSNIVLLESFSSDSKESLFAKEAFYIKLLKCVNKFIPLRTKKEYNDDNKEFFKQYHEQYQPQYYLDNHDKISKRHEQYRQDNKEKIKERNKNKILCNCGKEICYGSKIKHCKSIQHNKLMLLKDIIPV